MNENGGSLDVSSRKRYEIWGGLAAAVGSCDDFNDGRNLEKSEYDLAVLLKRLDALEAARNFEEVMSALQTRSFTEMELNRLNSPLLDGLVVVVASKQPAESKSKVPSEPMPPTPFGMPELVNRLLAQPKSYPETFQFLLHRGANRFPMRESALVHFCRFGPAWIVELLLDQGADITHQCHEPLNTAAAYGQTDILLLLLKRGASVHFSNDRPLRLACFYGRLPTVHALIANGADVNCPGDDLDNQFELPKHVRGQVELSAPIFEPIVAASSEGHLEVVRTLLDAGADPKVRSAGGADALTAALIRKHGDLALLLMQRGAMITEHTLRLGAWIGNIAVMKIALDHGVDIHFQDDRALLLAAEEASVEAVLLLLEHGANIHAYDDAALRFSAAANRLEVVRLLLSRGALVNVRNSEPLCAAAEEGFHEMVKLLLSHGADPFAANGAPLLRASKRGHVAVMRALLSATPHPEVRLRDQRYLCHAVQSRNPQAVALILDYQHRKAIDPEALRLAASLGAADVVQLLLDRGAPVGVLLEEVKRWQLPFYSLPRSSIYDPATHVPSLPQLKEGQRHIQAMLERRYSGQSLEQMTETVKKQERAKRCSLM